MKNGERKNSGELLQEKGKECWWANLRKAHSGIPGSGIPFNSNRFFCFVIHNMLKDFPHVGYFCEE